MGTVTCLCCDEGMCRGFRAVSRARGSPGMARVAFSDEGGCVCVWEEGEGKCLAQGVAQELPHLGQMPRPSHFLLPSLWRGVIPKVGNPHVLPRKGRGEAGVGRARRAPPGRLEQAWSPEAVR